MPSFDIFCLRIFIAFSRLSRTSTSSGRPSRLSKAHLPKSLGFLPAVGGSVKANQHLDILHISFLLSGPTMGLVGIPIHPVGQGRLHALRPCIYLYYRHAVHKLAAPTRGFR